MLHAHLCSGFGFLMCLERRSLSGFLCGFCGDSACPDAYLLFVIRYTAGLEFLTPALVLTASCPCGLELPLLFGAPAVCARRIRVHTPSSCSALSVRLGLLGRRGWSDGSYSGWMDPLVI